MRDFLILLLIALTVALGVWLLHRRDTPPPQQTHTVTPKARDCDPSEMTLECNGSRPR
jgi:hypothetical protein